MDRHQLVRIIIAIMVIAAAFLIAGTYGCETMSREDADYRRKG
jgi:hypothetical protein